MAHTAQKGFYLRAARLAVEADERRKLIAAPSRKLADETGRVWTVTTLPARMDKTPALDLIEQTRGVRAWSSLRSDPAGLHSLRHSFVSRLAESLHARTREPRGPRRATAQGPPMTTGIARPVVDSWQHLGNGTVRRS